MGQAKNRGTFEQRVAQAKQREADRIAAAKAVEDEQVHALVMRGEDPAEEDEQVHALVMRGEDPVKAVRIVRSGGYAYRDRAFASLAAALALAALK